MSAASATPAYSGGLTRLLRVADVRPGEPAAVACSAAYLFCVFAYQRKQACERREVRRGPVDAEAPIRSGCEARVSPR